MKLELLAPAGSYEGFEAALRAGADAVYLGGNAFGARAYAANLDDDQLIRAIDTAHILDKKLYLTVNTLVKNSEFGALYDFLLPLYEQGLDAVIVQDTGVLSFIRRYFPGLSIHASTQMTITGACGAALLEKAGVKRVIPAREISLEEIRQIHERTSLEIECFVHGALCYCYSGQCLMSSMIGGRSGNRGRCAGICRLPYTVFDRNGKQITGKDGSDSYALNTKDICAASYITDMAEAGVVSFKIEGRMKAPEYTAGVVGIYRKYIDLFESGQVNTPLDPEDQNTLEGLFNREGFGRSYLYEHNGPGMMAVHGGVEGDKSKRSKEVYDRIRKQMKDSGLSRTADLAFRAEEGSMTLNVSSGGYFVTAESTSCEKAQKNPADQKSVEKQLKKTGGTWFVPGRMTIDLKGDLFIPVASLNALRRDALEKLEEKITKHYKRTCSSGGFTVLKEQAKDRKEGGTVETISVLCSDPEQIRAVLREDSVSKVYVPYRIYKKYGADEVNRMFAGHSAVPALALPYMRGVSADKKCMEILNRVISEEREILVRNTEDAAMLIEKGCQNLLRLDQGIYTLNRYASGFWSEQGIHRDTVPCELNEKELLERNCGNSEMVVYGRVPLMISAQCIAKTYHRCRHDNGGAFLRDRKGFCFPVSFECDFCYNVIYNSVPTSLISLTQKLSGIGTGGYRFEFTDESPAETVRILRAFRSNCLNRDAAEKEWFEYTRGHFNRGML